MRGHEDNPGLECGPVEDDKGGKESGSHLVEKLHGGGLAIWGSRSIGRHLGGEGGQHAIASALDRSHGRQRPIRQDHAAVRVGFAIHSCRWATARKI